MRQFASLKAAVGSQQCIVTAYGRDSTVGDPGLSRWSWAFDNAGAPTALPALAVCPSKLL
jgi:hypothetical protein